MEIIKSICNDASGIPKELGHVQSSESSYAFEVSDMPDCITIVGSHFIILDHPGSNLYLLSKTTVKTDMSKLGVGDIDYLKEATNFLNNAIKEACNSHIGNMNFNLNLRPANVGEVRDLLFELLRKK